MFCTYKCLDELSFNFMEKDYRSVKDNPSCTFHGSASTCRKWTSTMKEQEKDCLAPIVEALSSSYLGPEYFQPKGLFEVSVKDIDELANSSFPLCMRHLFEKLREDYHLKQGGRMQLGLFLKGVGLKVDNVLAFWRVEFSQKMVKTRNSSKKFGIGSTPRIGDQKLTTLKQFPGSPCSVVRTGHKRVVDARDNLGVKKLRKEDMTSGKSKPETDVGLRYGEIIAT